MGTLPLDPFGEDTTVHNDACTAVGVAVLDILAEGSRYAIVTADGKGGYDVTGEDEEANDG